LKKYSYKHSKKLKLLREFQSGKIDRRSFLVRLGALSSLVLLPPILTQCKNSSERDPAVISEKRWSILNIVQNQLFPSATDSPGAKDINAAIYLQNVLLDPQIDEEDKEFILNGLDWVEETAEEVLTKTFLSLDTQQAEKVLRDMAEYDWGESWLSLILLYIFEALLTDPIYGGNPDAIGWKWLEHDPGLSHPTEKNRYGKL